MSQAQLIERLQREAARRPGLYRMRLAALAAAACRSGSSSTPMVSGRRWILLCSISRADLLEEVPGEPLEHLRRLEKDELSAWYSTFAAPAWRLDKSP